MARKLQKLLSLVLALSMCMSLLSVTALAEGEDETTSAAPSSVETTGTAETPTVTGPNVIGASEDGTEKVTKDENGNTTTEKWTETTWKGETTTPPTDDGVTPETTTVEGKETTKDKTVTDQSGNITSQEGTVEGEETTTKDPSAGDKGESSDVGVKEDKKSITVNMTPGKSDEKDSTISRELDTTKFEKWVRDALGALKDGEDGESSTAGSTEKDADGNDTAVTGAVTNVTVKDNEDGTKTLTRTVTKTDGTKSVEKVTLTYSDDGERVVGYSKETTTTTVTDATREPETPDNATVGTGTADDNQTTYIFEIDEPDDIAEADQLKEDADGNLNGQAYLPLSDGKTVIGYVKVTYMDGKATYGDPVLGTYYATTTKTETLENGLKKTTTTKTKVTDTTTIKNSVSVEDGTWTVTGGMGAVTEGKGHGDIKLDSPQPNTDLLYKSEHWDGTSENDHLGQLYDPPTKSTFNKEDLEPGKLWYDDYGLYTNIGLSNWTMNSSGTWDFGRTQRVHQFKLLDSEGNTFYAYCADWTTSAYVNSKYTMENVLDADYIQSEESRKKLQVIAQNGYWGTTSGPGSLAEVKTLVDSKYWGALDDGIALAVTQAAIWTYGNQENNGLTFGGRSNTGSSVTTGYQDLTNKSEELLEFWFESNHTTAHKLTDDEKAAAVALYNALCGLSTEGVGEKVTDIITKDDIKSASITVIDKVESKAALDEAVAEVAEATKNTYNTNLSFTLAVVPSQLSSAESDHLTVYVYGNEVDAAGKPVAIQSVRLIDAKDAISDSSSTFTVSYDETTGEATYTIKGLELQEGVNINLTLQGTQNLKGGAYLFTSSDKDVAGGHDKSQTFVGLVTDNSTRYVNLNVDLKFTVKDPGYEADTKSSSTDSTQVEWSASYETYRIPLSDGDDDDDDDENPTPTPEGEKPTPTPEGGGTTPEGSGEEGGNIPGGTPTTNIPGGTPTTGIPDDVPATNVPKTGDSSVLWYVLSACSGLGLAGTALIGKKRRDDED